MAGPSRVRLAASAVLVMALAAVPAPSGAGEPANVPSNAELYQMLLKQQKELMELKRQTAAQDQYIGTLENRAGVAEKKLDAAKQELESVRTQANKRIDAIQPTESASKAIGAEKRKRGQLRASLGAS